MNDKFTTRFAELEAQATRLDARPRSGFSGLHYARADYTSWGTSAQNLLLAVFGKASPYYENFVSALTECTGHPFQVDTLRSIFRSAKEAFDGGYVFNVELTVSGELFGDFVAMAKRSLSEGHRSESVV